jgi:hypothetical protein
MRFQSLSGFRWNDPMALFEQLSENSTPKRYTAYVRVLFIQTDLVFIRQSNLHLLLEWRLSCVLLRYSLTAFIISLFNFTNKQEFFKFAQPIWVRDGQPKNIHTRFCPKTRVDFSPRDYILCMPRKI